MDTLYTATLIFEEGFFKDSSLCSEWKGGANCYWSSIAHQSFDA